MTKSLIEFVLMRKNNFDLSLVQIINIEDLKQWALYLVNLWMNHFKKKIILTRKSNKNPLKMSCCLGKLKEFLNILKK